MTIIEIVTWRELEWSTADLVGFEVEATDGKIGKVDDATRDVQMHGFIVVDTGPWIFGKKTMLPAGIIQSVDLDEQKVYVNRMKDEIKNAPEFDEDTFREEQYRSRVGSYFSDSTDRATTR
jgi:hypothetical protein